MPVSITNGSLKYATPTGLDANPFTIEGWFYLDDVATQQYLVHLHTSGDASFYTIFQITAAAKVSILVGGTGSGISTTSLVAKRWYHLVWTCSNESTTPATNAVYIDGVAETMSASNVAVGTHTGSACVSGRADTSTRRIVRGTAHRVRIYKTTVTAGEVLAAYNDPLSAFDLATVKSADLVFRTDFDANTNDSKNGTSATVSGTAALTERYPGDIPGLGFWGLTASASNTVTAGRIATLADLSGNANHAVEVSSSGPTRATAPSGLPAHAEYPDASTRYLQQAASGGMHHNSQNASVVAWYAADKLGLGQRQTLVHLGDPATNSAGVVEFEINTVGRASIGTVGGTHFVSDYMTSCGPRMITALCATGAKELFNDTAGTSEVGAFSAATSNGFRIGARCKTGALTGGGASDDRPLFGSLFELLIYQRVLASTDRVLLDTYGKSQLGYSTATRSITMEGSSTFDGYGVVPGGNIAINIATTITDAWIFNFGNSSENRAHFNSQYATQTGAAATLAGFTKANRILLLQPFGNDWSDTGTPTLASIETDYSTFVTSATADYGSFYAMYPQPRTNGGSETWDDTDDEARETDLLEFMTWLRNSKGFTVARRPTELTPASEVAADLQAITADTTYYQADETHLNITGLGLVGTSIAGTIEGTQRGWSPGTGSLLMLLD